MLNLTVDIALVFDPKISLSIKLGTSSKLAAQLALVLPQAKHGAAKSLQTLCETQPPLGQHETESPTLLMRHES